MISIRRTIAVAILITFFLESSAYCVTNPQIKQKKAEMGSVNKQIDALNQKLEVSVDAYNEAYSKIGQTRKRIIKAKEDIYHTTAELKFDQNILNQRAKSLYVNGKPSFVDVFFSVADYTDLYKVVDYYKFIIKQDSNAIDNVRDTKEKLEFYKTRLDADMARKELEADSLAEKKLSVENALNEKQAVLNTIKGQLKELQEQEKERLKRIREEALKKLKNIDLTRLGENSQVVTIAKKYLGVRYTWGGESPQTGFDCSGLAQFCYKQIGVDLPRTASLQHGYLVSKGRAVDESSLTPGDLVFYGRSRVSHVVIYMGAGYIIGASGGQYISGEVKILPLHYRSDYVGAGRP